MLLRTPRLWTECLCSWGVQFGRGDIGMPESPLATTDEPDAYTLLLARRESEGRHQPWECWCGHGSPAETTHFWYSSRIECRDCFSEVGDYAAAAYWRPLFGIA